MDDRLIKGVVMMAYKSYKNEERERLLSRVAWLYYSANLTQQVIADRLGLNRVRVNKLLGEAREKGIITIQFNMAYCNEFRLEESLCTKYGLKNVILVPTIDDKHELKRAIGQAAANFLDNILTTNDVLATAWGTTVYEVAYRLKPRRKLENLLVTQLMGALSNSPDHPNPPDIAKMISEKYKAGFQPLFAPIIVDNKAIRDALLSDQSIKRMFEIARSATKALVGIGPVDTQSTFVRAGYLKPDYIEILKSHGAIGDIVGRYYDIQGNPVASTVDERAVSLNLSDIRNIDMVIGVAGGQDKAMAILGALKGGLIDVLVTDEATAERVLDCDTQAVAGDD